jgi:hypothetical protein
MREENRNKFSDKKNKSIFIFHHKIVELIKQKNGLFYDEGGGPGGNGGCDDCAYI